MKGRNRWLLAGVGLCLASVVIVYGLGRASLTAHASEGVLEEIRANNFVLEDAKGKPHSSLGMDEDGVVLRMRYENGNIGAALCLHEEKAVLNFSDNSGKPRSPATSPFRGVPAGRRPPLPPQTFYCLLTYY